MNITENLTFGAKETITFKRHLSFSVIGMQEKTATLQVNNNSKITNFVAV